MSKKKFSRPSLALFTAIALSGGAFFAPSFASAADVTIDSTHPPQRNVPNPDDPSTPNSAASVGTGSEDASGNSLTVDRYQEDTLSVFGGVARGTGNADGNTVRIKGATTEIASVYGGAAWGIGHARENRVRFDAGTMSFAEWLVGGYVGRSGKAEENTVEVNGGKAESLYGGFSNSTNAAGHIYKNHVIIRNGTVAGKVYGGAFGGAHATGDVTYNTVTITGGTLKKVVCGGSLEKADSTGNVAHNEVTVAGGVFRGDVYGGYTRRGGALTGNIVTITGGELNSVYAANSAGNVSEIKGNVVNLGDGKNEMKAGYRIAKYIFGASGGNRAAYADNTLNVKASARAKNIVNFDKVNFYFTDTLQPRLTLRDSTGTKFKSLKDITIYGSPSTPAGTLIENNTSGGIVVRDGVNTVVRTGDTAEVTLEKDATGRKILYSRLIFKGATTAESDGTHIWGGRSVIGNTTTGNDVALANGSYVNAFGGWTTGAGSDAAADKLGDSTGNKIAVSGTANVTGTVYGGYTDAAGGKARGNTVTIESAVHDVVGGEGAGEASGNIVNVRANAAAVTGGRSAGAATNNRVMLGNITIASVVGGDAAATAEGNTVSLDGTAVTNDVIGGRSAAANGNTVNLKDATVNGVITGGHGTVQSDGNTVSLQNTTVNGAVTGGYGAAANDNIVNLGNVTVASVTGGEGATTNNNEVHLNGNTRVTGALKGGSQASGTGNTLSIKGRGNKAGAITGFQKLTFDAAGLLKGDTMLEVTGTGETAVDWASLTAMGTAAKPLTLLKNEQGINLAHYTGAAKSETGDEAETNIDVRKSGARITAITYEGYRFKGATQATRDGVDAYGGRSKAGNSTRKNEIALASGTHANVYGGWTSGVGTTAADKGASYENKVKVSGTATVTGTVYGGYTDAAGGKARGNTVTIGSAVHDVVGGEGAGEASGNIVNIRANAAAVTGGRSAGAASNNRVTLGNITAVRVVGGDAATIAEGNAVSLDGTTVTNDVIGGRGAAANGNTVDLKDATVNGAIMGGHGTVQSDGNIISLQNATVNGAVTGGYGTATNGNIIHLRNTVVKGIVTGGTASGSVGNTLAVYYSAGTSSIHDFKGIESLRLDVEDAPTDGTAHTLLKLTNVSGGSKNLKNMTLDFRRSGAARKLQAGDSFTLLENASGKITVGEGVTMKGTDGIAHDCLFAIAPDKAHPEKLRATVTKTGVSETAKSPVETRAGLANFVNQGADYLVEIGFAAAELSAENASADDAAESRASVKDMQRRTAASDPASYHLWAGAGANAMRVESGSHVDSKGWNLGVGWAREDAAKDGTKRLFSPFVEYGRSTYDSYLDNGAHGSGKLSYLGLGVLGKLMQQDGLWLEASVRAGRAKSDYSLHGENAGYDGSNTYYGIHLGVGKTFALQKGASLDAYVRYFWSHQDGMAVKLRGSGDAYDFADVDSHRLRLGLRYSRKDRSTGECYAGLAWEYELGGEASASVGGDAAPSPSLKGSSYMLELGYRFLPQNSRVSYDFHINGWQGKRKGLSGGAVIRWAF